MKMRRKMVSLLLAAGLLSLTAGCSGTRSVDSIAARALFTGDLLQLDIPVTRAETQALDSSGFMTFRYAGSYVELFDEVERVKAEETELFSDQDAALFLAQEPAGRQGQKDYYCLRYTGGEGGLYYFSGMYGELFYDEEAPASSFRLLFPQHLLDDARVTGLPVPELYAGGEYEVSGAPDEWFDFYAQSGWYQTERQGDATIVLKGYAASDEALDREELQMPGAVTLQFRTAFQKTFVRLEVA